MLMESLLSVNYEMSAFVEEIVPNLCSSSYLLELQGH
jgi:hypothetical protein